MQTADGKIKLGDDLNDEQMEALKKVSLTGDQILDNLDNLNEEIGDLIGQEIPKTNTPNNINKIKKVKSNMTQTTMTLDEELEQMNKKLDAKLAAQEKSAFQEEPEEPEEEVAEQGSIKDQVIDLLKKSKGAPSEQQIAKWKAQHGQNGVYAIGMGEGDVYVFTHLKRGQWKKIQEIMQKMQAQDDSFDAEDEMKKKVVQYCTLWPQQLGVEFFYNSRAGVLDAIYQSILLNSYFLSPQQT
jgi:vacuolar-type H+-ATPase subunit I/STV1